jgi:beta-lactamase class A
VDATRRRLLACSLALPLLAVPLRGRAADVEWGAQFMRRIAALEAAHGGRLGVAALDVATGRCVAHRGGERFMLCSTFKVPAVAYVLDRVQAGLESLSRKVRVAATDLVTYAPILETRVGQAMTVAQLCEAALTVSDNAAANLLLRSFGGPAALTAYLRRHGDATTRLDRIETTLNAPESTRTWDTTSPVAMARLWRALLFGDALDAAHVHRLLAWTTDCRTGTARLRAGLPAGWHAGDKTGTGPTTTNDVAWIRTGTDARWILAAYYADSTLPIDDQNAVLAEVGREFAAFAGA